MIIYDQWCIIEWDVRFVDIVTQYLCYSIDMIDDGIILIDQINTLGQCVAHTG